MGEPRPKAAKAPDTPAASLCLSPQLHSLLLRCLVPWGLLTRDLQKSLHGPCAPQVPAGGAKAAFMCVHTQPWLLPLPNLGGGQPGGRSLTHFLPSDHGAN